jgi:PAS domain S-box-containing protein
VDAFAEIVHRQHLNTGWIISILDRRGVMVARAPDNIALVGKMAGPVVLPLLLTQSEGVVESTSQDGVPVVSAFSHVPNIGWSVVIGLPRAEFVDPAKRAAWVTFGVGTACLILGLGLAHAMARRIARPIASLQELSVALEQNNPGVRLDTGLAETDKVAQALVVASCKRRVAEATSRQAEREHEQAAVLLRTVIETTPSLIYSKDRAGRMVLANGAFLEIVGRTWAEVVGRTDLEFRDDRVQAETVVAADHRIMANGETEVTEEVFRNHGNRTRVWFSTKTPLRNLEMEVIGLVSVMVDITERKQVEDRLRQMVNELNHRVKNTLASVQAIALHTLRGADQAIQRALEGRLMALASAHDVLTRERWVGANLIDVIAGALMPYGGVEDDRFQVAGPPLRLQPRAAVALAMGLHELATNALKYGAMSVDRGTVELSWTVVEDHPPRLRMIWSEQGGPPVIAPVKRGFGTRLIERSLAHDLAGTAQITFASKGVTCVIDAPLSEVVATAEVMVLPQVGRNQKWH